MTRSISPVSNRPTSPEDEFFLWQMLYFASHSNDELGVRPDDIKSNPDLTGYIEGWRAADHTGVIAERDQTPLGAAWLRMLGQEEEGNPVFVDSTTPELAVAVEPGSQGQGIGTSMLGELMRLASDRFPAVVLSARAESPAIRLYERTGFAVVAKMTNRVGTDSVKMICTF